MVRLAELRTGILKNANAVKKRNLRRLWILLCSAAAVVGVCHASSQAASRHLVTCLDIGDPATKQNAECVILTRKLLAPLPAKVVWRIESFSSAAAARGALTPNGALVRTRGHTWLMTLDRAGKRAPGSTFVSEVGPLPIQRAAHLELLVGEANFSDGFTRVHVHPGVEAWYVVSGAQCVETPGRFTMVSAGESMFEPSRTPMQFQSLGDKTLDALFIVVYDPKDAWTEATDWEPIGLCGD